jgi:hypothetical protein
MAGTGEAWLGPAGSGAFGLGRPSDEQISTYKLHRVTGLLAFPYAVRWLPPGPTFTQGLTWAVTRLAVAAPIVGGLAAGVSAAGIGGFATTQAKKLVPYAKAQAKDIASNALSSAKDAAVNALSKAEETLPQVTDTLSAANQTVSVPSNANTYVLFGGGAIVLILIIVMMMRK